MDNQMGKSRKRKIGKEKHKTKRKLKKRPPHKKGNQNGKN
jgi:hypothetical protein